MGYESPFLYVIKLAVIENWWCVIGLFSANWKAVKPWKIRWKQRTCDWTSCCLSLVTCRRRNEKWTGERRQRSNGGVWLMHQWLRRSHYSYHGKALHNTTYPDRPHSNRIKFGYFQALMKQWVNLPPHSESKLPESEISLVFFQRSLMVVELCAHLFKLYFTFAVLF